MSYGGQQYGLKSIFIGADLAALIVIIVTGVFLAFALINLTVIVAQELAQLVAGASASSNAQLSQGLTNTFQLANPDLAKAGPISRDHKRAWPRAAAKLPRRSLQTAQGVVRSVLLSIPLLLAQLIIVFFLLLGILYRGDTIVSDFRGAVPAKYRSTVNRFLDHLNPIFYTFFVIYVAVAVICAILAAIIYGLLGVPYFITFAVFILFIGLIPSVGRALIYIPLAIWLLIQGQTLTGLLVLIFSIVVFELVLRYTIQPRWMLRTGRVPKPLSLIAFTFALAAFGPIGFCDRARDHGRRPCHVENVEGHPKRTGRTNANCRTGERVVKRFNLCRTDRTLLEVHLADMIHRAGKLFDYFQP